MSLQVRPETSVEEQTVEKLQQRYLNRRRKQLPSGEKNTHGISHMHRGESPQKPVESVRYKLPTKEMKGYDQAVQDLFKAVTNSLDDYLGIECGLHDELSWADSLQDSHVIVTETDVTLPSGLDESLGSPDTAAGEASGGRRRRRRRRGERRLLDSCPPSSSMLGTIYQEMMAVYEQLKAERVSQQQWERELEGRERRIQQQEEETLGRLSGLEETVHTLQQKHQQEVSQLQASVRDRSKENRRLRSSFDAIKELNENMKRQLNDVSDHNKKLELQSKRVQARLDNLQRKCELRVTVPPRGHENTCTKNTEVGGPLKVKREKTAPSGKPSNKGTTAPAPLKLLGLLLDWLLDGQPFSPLSGAEGSILGQSLPPEVLHKERCSKVLPLLAEQLHRTPSSEPFLLLSLLRFIYWTLRHMDTNTQAVAFSSTLRRIGEEVSRLTAQSEETDPVRRDGAHPHRTCPLYRSPCPHTRVLSILIALRTVTQADVLALALGSLHGELACEQSRGAFLRHGGVCVLLSLLRAGRGGLTTPTDVLMTLTTQSRFLVPFLEACSCEDFFRTVSQLLKNPRMELPVLEKLSILLQKLSSIRKNRRLFELSSLHPLLMELHRTTDPSNTFLCLNLSSILLNLK